MIAFPKFQKYNRSFRTQAHFDISALLVMVENAVIFIMDVLQELPISTFSTTYTNLENLIHHKHSVQFRIVVGEDSDLTMLLCYVFGDIGLWVVWA